MTQIDYQILLFIQEHLRSDVLTPIFKAITSLGNMGWFGIAVCLILLIPKKTRKMGMAGLLAIILAAVIGEGFIKHIVQRQRPYLSFSDLQRLIAPERTSSFPSGHSSSAFAWTTAIYCCLDKPRKKKGLLLFLLPALIAFSRLYVGVHYPSDVLVGCLLGIFCGWLAAWLLNWYLKRRMNQSIH